MSFLVDLETAAAVVEAWISQLTSVGWLEVEAGGWSNKDLLGHLTAWSDLLMDQVEALQHERPDRIETVEVDAWNADQIAKRRHAAVGALIAEWHHALQRVRAIASGLTPETARRPWRVAWAPHPVCIEDLLDLWVAHIEQHGGRLERRRPSVTDPD